MIIVDTENCVVFGDALGMDENRCYGPRWSCNLYTTANATIVDVAVPAGFVAGQFDYVDGVFSANANYVVPIPVEIAMRQARLALLGAGILGNVQTAIDGLSSPQKEAAQIEWDYSNALRRDNAFVQLLAPALGLPSEQVDNLFRAAILL